MIYFSGVLIIQKVNKLTGRTYFPFYIYSIFVKFTTFETFSEFYSRSTIKKNVSVWRLALISHCKSN